ncbi:MAG: hypothetical protein NE334_06685 [Lentisphaeraceae bacterium]|nr:hypothetical protein [Lentisphaeraceae bacterium]
MNHRVTGKNQQGASTTQGSTANISPSETCLLMDSYNAWRSTGHYNMTVDRVLTDGDKVIVARHLGKANVTMFDGSGRSRSAKFLMSTNDFTNTFWDPEQ